MNLDRFSRPGPYEVYTVHPDVVYLNVCEVCEEYEAVVSIHNTRHCEECAKEYGVEML